MEKKCRFKADELTKASWFYAVSLRWLVSWPASYWLCYSTLSHILPIKTLLVQMRVTSAYNPQCNTVKMIHELLILMSLWTFWSQFEIRSLLEAWVRFRGANAYTRQIDALTANACDVCIPPTTQHSQNDSWAFDSYVITDILITIWDP